jgi:hypothetical protein
MLALLSWILVSEQIDRVSVVVLDLAVSTRKIVELLDKAKLVLIALRVGA